MFSRLMDVMFGCWHSRYSFPMTVRSGSRRNPAAARVGTYVVCLDCGKEHQLAATRSIPFPGNQGSSLRSDFLLEAAASFSRLFFDDGFSGDGESLARKILCTSLAPRADNIET
jgi:hypothetical protein